MWTDLWPKSLLTNPFKRCLAEAGHFLASWCPNALTPTQAQISILENCSPTESKTAGLQVAAPQDQCVVAKLYWDCRCVQSSGKGRTTLRWNFSKAMLHQFWLWNYFEQWWRYWKTLYRLLDSSEIVKLWTYGSKLRKLVDPNLMSLLTAVYVLCGKLTGWHHTSKNHCNCSALIRLRVCL